MRLKRLQKAWFQLYGSRKKKVEPDPVPVPLASGIVDTEAWGGVTYVVRLSGDIFDSDWVNHYIIIDGETVIITHHLGDNEIFVTGDISKTEVPYEYWGEEAF